MTTSTNWGGNLTYRAREVVRPTTFDELSAAITAHERIAVIGTRHAFGAIGDADVLIDLASLDPSTPITDDIDGLTIVSARSTYAEVCPRLDAAGCALHNLASLPHISIGGAISTATHGSGRHARGLAASVGLIEVVDGEGRRTVLRDGDPDFDGTVVGLGSLGAITRVGLRTEPAYEVSQTVYEGLSWDTLAESFDEVMSLATSVSVFTRWGSGPMSVWCKQRTDAVVDATTHPRPSDLGLVAATTAHHPIPGASPASCTPQLGRPGPWWTRLTHFRADSTPSNGEEIQSEFFVDLAHAPAAVDALRMLGDELDDVLLVSEIRTVAADTFWMSPCRGVDSVGFHFTWRMDPERTAAAVEQVGRALGHLAPRPHWGKVFPDSWTARRAPYDVDAFLALKGRLDPNDRFTTPWFDRVVRAGT